MDSENRDSGNYVNKKFRILYAEDEELLREVTTELLISEGFDCVAVANGLDARELIEKRDFDLIITDFKMPVMDGAELLFWIRANRNHIPVIFVSGNLERAPKEELALGDCCTSLIVKPVAFDTLLEAIRASLNRQHKFDCMDILEANSPNFQGQHIRR